VRPVSRIGIAVLLVLAAAAALVAGCGGSSESEPVKLSLTIAEQGKESTFTAPKSSEGGLVEVSLANKGKAPHGVQFIQYTGGHSEEEVLKELGSDSEKIPSWIRLWGGIGSVAGGQSDSAVLKLPEGNYVLADAAAFSGPSGGPPATAPLKLSGEAEGDLPGTPATVTAASPSDDKFKWETSGLRAGRNTITFNSEGEKAVHVLIAVPITGKAPPVGQIEKELASNGPPPPYADVNESQSTALVDGGASQTATITLKKPGKYIFFCPLTDRDGGKPHFEEGLLSVEDIK
jgi:hypothetical protein